jgi:hypothetical protein
MINDSNPIQTIKLNKRKVKIIFISISIIILFRAIVKWNNCLKLLK